MISSTFFSFFTNAAINQTQALEQLTNSISAFMVMGILLSVGVSLILMLFNWGIGFSSIKKETQPKNKQTISLFHKFLLHIKIAKQVKKEDG